MIRIVNISDPENMSSVNEITIDNGRNAVLESITLFVAGYNFLKIFDISDPSVPVQHSTISLDSHHIAQGGNYLYTLNMTLLMVLIYWFRKIKFISCLD